MSSFVCVARHYPDKVTNWTIGKKTRKTAKDKMHAMHVHCTVGLDMYHTDWRRKFTHGASMGL